MRPAALEPLFAAVSALPRLGRQSAKALGRLLPVPPGGTGEPRVVDLLWHFPVRVIDRRARPTIAELAPDTVATLKVTVDEHEAPRGRRPYKVHVSDASGHLALVFFHARPGYIQRLLPPGETRYVSGRVESYGGIWQMAHPDHVLTEAEVADMPAVEPVYPLTAGVANKALVAASEAALERVPKLAEWQEPAWLAERGWPDFKAALARVHRPQGEDDLDPASPARRRLAFDELLASQLALGLLRALRRRQRGRALVGSGAMTAPFAAALPFALTGGQEAAVAEIVADMARPEQMVRLLQGDVGSGKTVVAAIAMLTAVEAGSQAALMAPTELLARQHHETLGPLLAAAGAKAELLTGREKGAARRAILAAAADGTVDILIGTHALFQEEVAFRDLGLAVIDEQHRFGVHQRLALQAKSEAGAVDLLVMTATPIPRTLLLTHYGNMEVTRLAERPPGRGRVSTSVVADDRLDEAMERLARAVDGGARAYWICPQIDETGEDRTATAVQRFEELRARLGDGIALAHGRMAGTERDAAMEAFRAGAAQVLVATTVVEVGVDVPEATIMVVERADRFGLSQLHQLRGRIGRGGRDGACLLVYGRPLGEVAKARLNILRQTDDGFRIAEEDLGLRGGGEILGTRQSGAPMLRIADPLAHADLIEPARQQAAIELGDRARLEGPRAEVLRTLLYLFERDEAIRLTGSG